VDRKIQGTPSSASKDTPREKFWDVVGGGCKISDPSHLLSTPPLLGISGSDFSTLDLVSVLASLPFHGRGGEKEGGVPSQFESLISELNATAGRCRPRRGIRPSLRQRRLRLLLPGGRGGEPQRRL